MTQNAQVIKYILDFGSISTYEAFIDLGIARLGSRIHDLKSKYTMEVGSCFETKKNRYGKKVSFKRYSFPVKEREYAQQLLSQMTERKRK